MRSSKRNLLLVSNYPSDTSYAWWLMEHFWVTIAEYFTEFGSHVYLAYPRVTSVSKPILDSPIEVIELTIPWLNTEQASHAKRFIRDKGISFVYLTDQAYFNVQYAQMKHYGVQHIFVHDHTPGDRPPVCGFKGALKAFNNRLPWLTADRVLCVSEHMRKRCIANGRTPAYKCLVVQNGVQPVDCQQNKSTITRSSLGINNDSIVVTTTGRAHPYKRFDFVVECAKALEEQAPTLDVVFLLVGDGPAIPDLLKQIQSHKLEETVRLLGYRNDVHDILCTSDIALHASLGEGFSLSIIEYMSAGLPVLVPDIASVSQAITHNKTGLIYCMNDPQMVASYVADLASNKSKRQAIGAAAKTEANDKYSLDQCTKSFIRAIQPVFSKE